MVAFQAANASPQSSIGANQNILFEKVTLNFGNGFHSQSGIFIVPVNGIYVISVTTLHVEQSIDFHGAIVHQGNVVAVLNGHHRTSDQASQTVLIQANIGEEIWVKNVGVSDQYIYGDLFSTFSGFLIWEM